MPLYFWSSLRGSKEYPATRQDSLLVGSDGSLEKQPRKGPSKAQQDALAKASAARRANNPNVSQPNVTKPQQTTTRKLEGEVQYWKEQASYYKSSFYNERKRTQRLGKAKAQLKAKLKAAKTTVDSESLRRGLEREKDGRKRDNANAEAEVNRLKERVRVLEEVKADLKTAPSTNISSPQPGPSPFDPQYGLDYYDNNY